MPFRGRLTFSLSLFGRAQDPDTKEFATCLTPGSPSTVRADFVAIKIGMAKVAFKRQLDSGIV